MSNASGVTPKGVVGIIVSAVIGVPILIYLIIKLFTSGINLDGSVASMSKEAVAARLLPVGEVKISVTAAVGSRTGQMVYESICATCHATGLSGAPKFAEAGSWAPHLAKGFDILVKHAIEGFNAMPAKGGDPSLTDEEVARAVAYMGNSAGANFTEPPVANAAGAVGQLDPEIKGKEIYDTLCVTCHAAGLNGAPKLGDKAAWAPRLKGGIEEAIKIGMVGKGIMPPKGGYTGTDDEFAAAVRYLINHSQ
jgi:cytochrome c5